MVTVGDTAPGFIAPLVGDETEATSLEAHLGDGPVVLAFFPAAFSSTCTEEFCTFRDELAAFNDLGASVFGISTDTAYALERFRNENELTFGLISDNNGEIISAYDVVDDFEHIAMWSVAQRAVFVADSEGVVQYAWRADNPGEQPDYEAVVEAVEAVN